MLERLMVLVLVLLIGAVLCGERIDGLTGCCCWGRDWKGSTGRYPGLNGSSSSDTARVSGLLKFAEGPGLKGSSSSSTSGSAGTTAATVAIGYAASDRSTGIA